MRLFLALATIIVVALAACGGDDDDTVTDTPTATNSGPTTLEQSVITQTIDLLSQEPRNEFDPADVQAHLTSYADAYADIAAEAPELLGQLPDAPAGSAWLVRIEGTFIYTTTCPTGGCDPADGTYFFVFNEQGQLGQGIFVGDK